MDAYINDQRGSLMFQVDNRGLNIAYSYGSKKPLVLNVQEFEVSNTRDTIQINEVIIKNHSEFQGTVEALVSAKVIHRKPVRVIQLGYVKYGVYGLTPLAVEEIYKQNRFMRATG